MGWIFHYSGYKVNGKYRKREFVLWRYFRLNIQLIPAQADLFEEMEEVKSNIAFQTDEFFLDLLNIQIGITIVLN